MSEREPYVDERHLPAVELSDFGSDAVEPEGGRPDAEPPELERLDLTADEPGPEDIE